MHAARIYAGRKLFELRKVLPKELPRRVFLYETEKQQVTGHFVVQRIISASPQSLWEITGSKGTTKKRFYRYFEGKEFGHAFEISSVLRYRLPVRLNNGGLQCPIPQNFLYLASFPEVHRELRHRAFSEAIARLKTPFHLRPISNGAEEKFISLVQKHISGSYAETGERYARKVLQIHREGEDAEGVFSIGKCILEI